MPRPEETQKRGQIVQGFPIGCCFRRAIIHWKMRLLHSWTHSSVAAIARGPRSWRATAVNHSAGALALHSIREALLAVCI